MEYDKNCLPDMECFHGICVGQMTPSIPLLT